MNETLEIFIVEVALMTLFQMKGSASGKGIFTPLDKKPLERARRYMFTPLYYFVEFFYMNWAAQWCSV